jgi:hypothetical protein
MAQTLQLNQVRLPLPRSLRASTTEEILGKTELPVLPHKLTHQELVQMWQNRLNVCQEIVMCNRGVSEIEFEAISKLAELRNLEKKQ